MTRAEIDKIAFMEPHNPLLNEVERMRSCLEGAATAFTGQGDLYMSNVMIAIRDGVAPPMMTQEQIARVFGVLPKGQRPKEQR